MKFLRANFILYPILFGLYPILALISHNSAEMDFTTGMRALVASAVFTLLLNTILFLLIRDAPKTALLTSLIILLFYSYGHFNLLGREWTFFSLSIGRHRTLLPIYFMLLILVSWLILRTNRDLSGSTRILNAFALILLFLPLYQVTASQIERYQAQQLQKQKLASQSLVSLSEEQESPDVYYLLLDGYPRGDFINQHLRSSNLAFLESLEGRSFYVAHCSQANYSDTRFSLASTLNMEYLDDGLDLPEVVHSGAVLDGMIRSGEVQQNFADLGYAIITFESGYKWLRWELADQHLTPGQSRETQLIELGLNDFERLLLDTTAAKLLFDLPILFESNRMAGLAEILDNPRAAHRARVMYSLEQLPRMPASYPSPKFVYAQIIFPHPPFIVDAEGRSLQNSPPDELAAYADQITYLDQRLLEIVDALIEKSERPPIIIIQGDHGATIAYQEQDIDPAQRLGILNAYFLPGDNPGVDTGQPGAGNLLYPGISPVNSFRLVFDLYFNGEYNLLEDRSIVGRQSPYTELNCTMPE